MDVRLTEKAQKLYACIKKKGGGVLEEWWMRDQTGLSHGSFCAARKELVEAGLLRLGRDVRKTTYEPVDLTCQKLTCQESSAVTEKAPDSQKAAGKACGKESEKQGQPKRQSQAENQEGVFFAPSMPHIAGTFFDFDEWTDALMNALGDCLDISESLVEEGTYTVYSNDYECEDTYHTEITEDGFIVN